MCAITNDGLAPETGINRNISPMAVPESLDTRTLVRSEAVASVRELNRLRPLGRSDLETLADQLLLRAKLEESFRGYAQVEISNEFWRAQFAAVPFSRRLLLLPHCLRKTKKCTGIYQGYAFICKECGACALCGLKREAENAGYQVLIAEGTPAVVRSILGGTADAILGVACLDSLEKAFSRVVGMGIPHIGVPLLVDGCVETVVEEDRVMRWINTHSDSVDIQTRSYLSMIRFTERLTGSDKILKLLEPFANVNGTPENMDFTDPVDQTEKIALEWLREGGKRFRPFVTLAAYAVAVHGDKVLETDGDLEKYIPPAVQRVALAIETLHKASLIHDDIEDDDLFRYGRETLHRRYGSPCAINVGDYLVGLGYRLVAAAADEIEPECVADIITHLTEVHLKLCRGQGADLILRSSGKDNFSAKEIQRIYALKTAPAFEAALYAGLRLAEKVNGAVVPDYKFIRLFCRYLGVAYQVINDLNDHIMEGDKIVAGQDLLSKRPTILRAFAMEAAGSDCRRELREISASGYPEEEKIKRLREIYTRLGVFEKADSLIDKYRNRAKNTISDMENEPLKGLFEFVLETVL